MANKENVSETLGGVKLGEAMSILLIGLEEADGKLQTSPDPTVFKDADVFRTMKIISEEFPEIFPTLNFVPGPVPVSEELEHILFLLCSSGIATPSWPTPHRIEPEKKKAVLTVLLRDHSEEDLRAFLPIVERFNELMENYGKNEQNRQSKAII